MPLLRKPIELEFDLVDQDILDAVASHFAIGRIKTAHSLVFEGEQIVLLSEKSHTSRKMVLETDEGRYFLKQIPWYCDDVLHVEFSQRLVVFLNQTGMPVPRLCLTDQGKTWVDIGGYKFVLSDCCSGYNYSYDFQQDHSTAKILAEMHMKSKDMSLSAEDPRESLDAIVLAHIDLARERSQFDDSFNGRLDAMEHYTREHLTPPTTLTEYPVHGDFIPWNLAFTADGSVAAIYDFDNACVDSRLHDLGEALVGLFALRYIGQSSALRAGISLQLSARRTYDFINTYQAILPLSALELTWLPAHVLGCWWECLLLSYIKGEQTEGDLDDILKLPNVVSAWWEALRFKSWSTSNV